MDAIPIQKRNFKFLTSNGKKNTVISNLSAVNIFVGPNNSGKSRFLRSLLFQHKHAMITSGYTCIYIPILRGLRKFKTEKEEIKEDIYLKKTMDDYRIDARDIFTGLMFYEKIKEFLLGSHSQRQKIRDFENFLSLKFFNEEDISLVPNEESQTVTLKIGNDKDRPIHDLGDGMQAIIIATFPLFIYGASDKKLLLVIEEPELTLHPGIQRKLLEIYCDKTKFPNAIIFITTHSNHFLDLTLDYEKNISIFSVKKVLKKGFVTKHDLGLEMGDSGEREWQKIKQAGYINEANEITALIHNSKDVSEMPEHLITYYNILKYVFHIQNITPNKKILDTLGVRNSSVFLSNCIIWVEGISDRLYIREFLKLYFKEYSQKIKYEEDKHYSIVEYGGSNITHFNFSTKDSNPETINVRSISSNNFLIADNDGNDIENNKPNKLNYVAKLDSLKKLKKLFGNDFFANHREIEHLIPFKIYRKYCKNNKIDLKNNEELSFNMELEGISKTIGDILRDYFEIQNKSKDITCIGATKKIVALKLIEEMNRNNLSFNELSETSQKLIKKLYLFIQKNN